MSDVAKSGSRWQIEQVLALAPKPAAITAAQPLAVPNRWVGAGSDDRALWGRCVGGSAEPYECVVDHVGVAFRCSCPSRAIPCKHSLALLLLWVRGSVVTGQPPEYASKWVAARDLATTPSSQTPTPAPAAMPVVKTAAAVDPSAAPSSATAGPEPAPDPTSSRDDRVARMAAGLRDLDRWLDDRMRTGLADPALSKYETWDSLAARLIDAQVGGLANRVRRLAGMVGAEPDWHERVLAELGALHLLATAGRQLGSLAPSLADSVAVAVGWQVRQADVLAGVPETDHWLVMGRSDTREDRIEVRRIWLRGLDSSRWAMLLSFAAYGQSLDDSLPVGSIVHADVFRYPGALALRVLVGKRHDEVAHELTSTTAAESAATSVLQACAQVGAAVASEPWIERHPVCILASPARVDGRWMLTDQSGSVPLAKETAALSLLACSGGRAAIIMCEWTPSGLIPLTVYFSGRSIDIGPVVDASFVAAAS